MNELKTETINNQGRPEKEGQIEKRRETTTKNQENYVDKKDIKNQKNRWKSCPTNPVAISLVFCSGRQPI